MIAACRGTRVPVHRVADARPRTLVIAIGQARGGELAWTSLAKNLLAPMHADLATYFTHRWTDDRLESLAQYRWYADEYDDWGDVFNTISQSCGQNETQWHELCNVHDQWLGGIKQCGQPGSAGILLAFRYFVSQQIQLNRLHEQYDYFVLTRADHLHICPHDDIAGLAPDTLWIPSGENYLGWTDRHLVASADMFVRAMNMTKDIVCNAQHWTQVFTSETNIVNLETALKLYWNRTDFQVAELNRTMFSVKTEDDPSRWSIGENHTILSQFGLKVKYKSALSLALDHCLKKNLDHMNAHLLRTPPS